MKTKTTLFNYALALGFGVCGTGLFAQNRLKQTVFTGEPVVSQAVLAKYQSDLEPIVSKFSVSTLNDDAVFALAKESGNQTFNMTLNAGGHSWDLNLYRVDLRSDDFKAIGIEEGGRVYELPKLDPVTFRGYANGDKNQMVFGTISETFVSFSITDLTGSYNVEPVYWNSTDAASNDYVVYSTADFKANLPCGVVAEDVKLEKVPASESFNSTVAACVSFNAGLYGIKNLTTNKGGGTPAGCAAYLQGVFNSVQKSYADNFSIDLKLAGVVGSNDATKDPVPSTNGTTYLTNVANWGAGPNFAALGLSVDIFGVIGSWGSQGLSGIGGQSPGVAVCTAKRFMWSSDLTPSYTMAHEWGHMFGVPGHDNQGAYAGSCTNSDKPNYRDCACIMCLTAPPETPGQPNIGMAWPWTSVTIRDIIAAAGRATCKKACVDGPPTAGFSADNLSVCAGKLVTFTDASSGSPAPSSWAWDFGDGTTSSIKNPTKTYNTAGNYTVKLITSNSIGASAPVTKVVTVQAGGSTKIITMGPGSQTAYGTDAAYDDNNRQVLFTVAQSIVLKSVTIFTGKAGTRSLYVFDDPKISRAEIKRATKLCQANSKEVIPINITCVPGFTYNLAVNTGTDAAKDGEVNDLYRHRSGASYPVSTPGGEASVIGNMHGPAALNAWYIAYQWDFEIPGCGPVSINELTNNSNLSVYPNPTNGVFTIQSLSGTESNAKVEVYSLVGQKVYSTSTILGNNKTLSIDLTSNAKGIYMVRLISEDGSQSIQKIVVE